MPNGIDAQVDIELRPIEVVGPRQLYMGELANRCILKPGKFAVWEEELLTVQE